MSRKRRKRTKKTTFDTEKATFDSVIKALPDENASLPMNYILFLANLSPKEAERLKEVWASIPLRRRRAILEDAVAVVEEEFRYSFIDLGKIALSDPDAQVRFSAISALWEEEDKEVARRLLEIATSDPDVEVRAHAAAALSTYMFLGSLELLSESLLEQVENTLFGILEDEAEDERVRQAALGPLGYSLQRERVDGFIKQALESNNEKWLASALTAIANTMDEDWLDEVLRYLDHPTPAIRVAAARAAGMTEAEDALPKLLYLLHDANADVRMMAAWAISEIGGGEEIENALREALANATDLEEEEVIQDAISNLQFTNFKNFVSFPFLEFTDEELAEMMQIMDEDELREYLAQEEEEEKEMWDYWLGEDREE